MESASKALLIAGAILIAISVIAVAVAVASRGEKTLNEIGDIAINDMLVANQRNKFEKYEGQVTGAQLKECIVSAVSHNSNLKSDEKIYAVGVVRFEPSTGYTYSYVIKDDYMEDGGINTLHFNSMSTSIINTNIYTVQLLDNDNDGTIDMIRFIPN